MGMNKSIPIIRERESEAFILGNGREQEFPLTPAFLFYILQFPVLHLISIFVFCILTFPVLHQILFFIFVFCIPGFPVLHLSFSFNFFYFCILYSKCPMSSQDYYSQKSYILFLFLYFLFYNVNVYFCILQFPMSISVVYNFQCLPKISTHQSYIHA